MRVPVAQLMEDIGTLQPEEFDFIPQFHSISSEFAGLKCSQLPAMIEREKKEPNSEIQIWEKMALTERVIKSVIPSNFHENSWPLFRFSSEPFKPIFSAPFYIQTRKWSSRSVISCHYSFVDLGARPIYFWGQNSSFTKTRNHLGRSVTRLET